MSLLPNEIHPSWDKLLTNDFREKLDRIEEKLAGLPVHSSGYSYFPRKQNIMRFLSQDLQNVKCIILGMEPYPSWYKNDAGQYIPVATGRSFEIGSVDSWQQKFKQSSLRNMLKTVYYNETGRKKSLEEIREKISQNKFKISEPHKWFDELERAGVLFLNATLTVEPAKPDSHTDMWHDVMTEVIQFINTTADVQWLLFGNKAQDRIASALGPVDNVYACCHPRLPEFVDENIFGKIKDIKWNV